MFCGLEYGKFVIIAITHAAIYVCVFLCVCLYGSASVLLTHGLLAELSLYICDAVRPFTRAIPCTLTCTLCDRSDGPVLCVFLNFHVVYISILLLLYCYDFCFIIGLLYCKISSTVHADR